MQINRLFEIIYILLEKKIITAKELADKFEVSTRTIYRDIEILSASNVPIYSSKGKGGGIGILDGYVLNKSLLTANEQSQILFALQGMNKITNKEEKDILDKMSTIFNKSKTNWIEVDFSDWKTIDKGDLVFNLIKEAVLNRKVLEFTYYNSNGEEKKRQVEPLQMFFKDKAWYLKSYCRLKLDQRLFKISRMKDIKVLDETFNRELTEVLTNRQGFKTVKLKLEIKNDMSYRVYDEFNFEDITKKENGDFIVTVEFPENEWVYGYILSFGDSIKVISPQYVIEAIKEKLNKSIDNYII